MAFSRLFELREELLVFLTEYNADLASFIVDEIWLGKLAYLADIFNLINELNLSLQGRDTNILKTRQNSSIQTEAQLVESKN